MAPQRIRISFSALVRIKDDDRHVLFCSTSRPGVFSPPGGVYKYLDPAKRVLEEMGFEPDRPPALADDVRHDLRGFLPVGSLARFQRWFLGGAYRESPTECLRRELAEELAEVELPHLAPLTSRLTFGHVRTLVAGPHPVPGRPYEQLRRFEIYDLVSSDNAAHRLRNELITAAVDPAVPTVVCATTEQIRHGRCGRELIGGHTAYLVGSERYLPELPMIR